MESQLSRQVLRDCLMQRAQNEQNLMALTIMIQRSMGLNIPSLLFIYSPSVDFRPILLTEATRGKDMVQGCDLWKLFWGGNWNEVEMASLPPSSEQVAACGSCPISICWMLVL